MFYYLASHKYHFILLIIVSSVFLFAPFSPTLAAGGLDARCWSKQDCVNFRQQEFAFSKDEAEKGFYQAMETAKACGESKKDVGFCLPAGAVETAVKFGGQTKFANLGVFIQYMYKYAVVAAGILAVVMIIIAGFQWVMSGGSPEKISEARKRISGAMMGLFLAVMSYFILNMVNPYMVNLRLPQVWLINPTSLVPAFCDQVEAKVVEAYKQGQQMSNTQKEEEVKGKVDQDFILDSKTQAKCGDNFFVQGGGAQTCVGTACPTDKKLCLKMTDKYDCYEGKIGGKIYASSATEDTAYGHWFKDRESWAWGSWPLGTVIGWVEGEIQLQSVCKNGEYSGELADTKPKMPDQLKKIQVYILDVSDSEIDKQTVLCKDKGGLKGFVLDVSFNEHGVATAEDHMIGANGVDLGDFQFGGSDAYATTFRTAGQEHFIQLEQLKAGLRMDIDVSRVCDIDNEDHDRAICYGYLGWRK